MTGRLLNHLIVSGKLVRFHLRAGEDVAHEKDFKKPCDQNFWALCLHSVEYSLDVTVAFFSFTVVKCI